MQQIKQIGHLLWWDLPTIKCSRVKLLDSAKNWQIPNDLLPNEIAPISALRRAITGPNKTKLKVQYKIELEENKSWKYRWDVFQVDKSGQRTQKNRIGQLTFCPIKHQISSIADHLIYDNQLADLVKFVEREQTRFSLHSTDDIRNIISGFAKKHGASLRQSGGIYFIPIAHANSAKNIKHFVESIGGKVYLKPEYQNPLENDSSLAEVAQQELHADLDTIRDQQQKILSEISDLATRSRSLTRNRRDRLASQIAEFEALKDRIRSFSAVLNFSDAQLIKEVADLALAIDAKLNHCRLAIVRDMQWVNNNDEDKSLEDNSTMSTMNQQEILQQQLQKIRQQQSTSKKRKHTTMAEFIRHISKN